MVWRMTTRRRHALTQRTEPAEHQTHLNVAVRALARLQQAVPADTAAARYCRVTLANLGHLESALRDAKLIPSYERR